jgi:hypothetical protein
MFTKAAAVFAGASVLLSGCSQVSGAVANVFGGGGENVVDAHTVYRLRPGCASLTARTLDHGFTILTPQDGGPFEISGLFEGPAREGESVFRYVPPGEGETWDTVRATDVFVEVHAVDVELPDVRVWMDRLCGPLPPGEGEPGQVLPRVPAAPASTPLER